MPPEAQVTKPIYNTKVDVFSYGNLMTHVFSGEWPIPTAAFRVDPSNLNVTVPATKIERIQGGVPPGHGGQPPPYSTDPPVSQQQPTLPTRGPGHPDSYQ